ncbi:hypothetical protein JCM9279_002930 [Rhodotorula babjevae]
MSDLCTVCDEPGTLWCAACKREKYCSPAHQRLLWPTHKFLCSRNLDVFCVPPLSDDEYAELDGVKERFKWPDGSTYVDVVTQGAGLDSEMWIVNRQLLRYPVVPTAGEVEWARMTAVLKARHCLDQAERQGVSRPPRAGRRPSATAWRMLGSPAFWVLDKYVETVAATGSLGGQSLMDVQHGAFAVLNSLLRTTLIAVTLQAQGLPGDRCMPLRDFLAFIDVHNRRSLEAVEAADLPEAVRARFKEVVHQEQESKMAPLQHLRR